MPTPIDTLRLLKSLESISEYIADIQNRIEFVIIEIGESASDVSKALSDAAISAGMPAGRAFDYAEEYAATVAAMKKRLGSAISPVRAARDDAERLAHIARVVPGRCPHPSQAHGTAVLMLR